MSKQRSVTIVEPSDTRPLKKVRVEKSSLKKPKVPINSTETKVSISAKGKQKALDPPEDKKNASSLPSTFKIVAGSYEKLLYGLEGSTIAENGKVEFNLKPIFMFPAHVSSIKSVAASPGGGKWLATGSADEIIKVWDLKRRKEIGGLMHHEGSITTLLFPSRSHLVSASEDGTIGIFHARDWSVLRTLRGHKGRVNSVDVHPSGKVALSVGKDRMLRMWDMMRGKGVASVKLGKEGELVRWSTDGEVFAVQSGKIIDIYSTDMSLLYSISHPSRLHDIRFCKPIASDERELLLVAAEDKKVSVYSSLPGRHHPTAGRDTEGAEPKLVAVMVGHENRVKAVQTLEIALPSPDSYSSNYPRTSTTIASTVSSDGNIHVYDLAELPEEEATSTPTEKIKELYPVATYDTKGTRLTCVTIGEGDITSDDVQSSNRKRKHEDEEDEGDVNEGEGWKGVGGDEVEVEEEEVESD